MVSYLKVTCCPPDCLVLKYKLFSLTFVCIFYWINVTLHHTIHHHSWYTFDFLHVWSWDSGFWLSTEWSCYLVYYEVNLRFHSLLCIRISFFQTSSSVLQCYFSLIIFLFYIIFYLLVHLLLYEYEWAVAAGGDDDDDDGDECIVDVSSIQRCWSQSSGKQRGRRLRRIDWRNSSWQVWLARCHHRWLMRNTSWQGSSLMRSFITLIYQTPVPPR